MLQEFEKQSRLPTHVKGVLGEDSRNAVVDMLNASTRDDPDFKSLTELAASIFEAPVALVTLVDRELQTMKAGTGTDIDSTPADISFCAHTIAVSSVEPLVVLDASSDPRFADNPLVTGETNIRFYAGHPLVVMGEKVGSLCVLDQMPRVSVSPEQMAHLARLAEVASSLFELKEGARKGGLAAAALDREEKRHTLALEAASIASWVWDMRTGVLVCDELLPRLFGLPAGKRLKISQVMRAIDVRDLRMASTGLREALVTGDDYSGVYRARFTSPTRWIAGRGRVLERDQDGRPILVYGVNFDVSESKLSEERQRLLLRELNHRVKNTLATVQALASQTVRHAREPREFLDAFSGRLQALGIAHSLLSDREWGGISLQEVVRLQAMPFTAAERPRIATEGPEVLLSPDQALAIGLILHELGSNALKHGALSSRDGLVKLSWSVGGARNLPRLEIHWQEQGGPAVSPPTRSGFGSILIRRSLDKVLTSEVEHRFPPTGVEARISVPIERL